MCIRDRVDAFNNRMNTIFKFYFVSFIFINLISIYILLSYYINLSKTRKYITSFCILMVNDLRENRLKESIGYYIVSFQLVLRVLLLTLINGLVIIGGLLLFIVPGIYLASRLLLSPYFLILEGKGVLESLDLSWQTTKTNQRNYILYLIYYWAALIFVTFFTLSIISAFAISSEPETNLFFTNSIANAFLSYVQLVLISYPLLFVYKSSKTS